MITAIDTNVLLDVLVQDPDHWQQSEALLKEAYEAGELILCEIVYAELAPFFLDRFGDQAISKQEAALSQLGVEHVPIDAEIAVAAGQAWLKYRRAGGPRQRILPDFLIGAHAMLRADSLLTRDRGFYQSYFPELRVRGIS